MPNIWMIISSFYPAVGGAEIQVQRLSKALIEKGWNIHILTRRHMSDFRNLQAKQILNGIPVTRLYSQGKNKIGLLLYMLGALWYLFQNGRDDIYHAHGEGTPSWIVVLAARLFGGRSLLKLRTGANYYQQRYFFGISGLQFRLLLRLTDQVIVVNREVSKWLISKLKIPSKKIELVPNSVNMDEFYPVLLKEKESQRRQLDLPLNKNIFLYVGRLSHFKGVDILLKAWNQVPKSSRQEMLLILVGDGPERQTLEQMCRDLDITCSVRMMGMRTNVRDYYWAADIFILPSRTEGQSNALVEAMACGLPSIVSAVGGGMDLIVNGQNGFLFELEKHEQLHKRIIKTLKIREHWHEMGKKARETALKKVALETNAARLHHIYLDLL